MVNRAVRNSQAARSARRVRGRGPRSRSGVLISARDDGVDALHRGLHRCMCAPIFDSKSITQPPGRRCDRLRRPPSARYRHRALLGRRTSDVGHPDYTIHRLRDALDLDHGPDPLFPARQVAGDRVEQPRARRAQNRGVALDHRLQPHLGVHRRGDEHAPAGLEGEEDGGEQVVGQAGGRSAASRSAVAGATSTISAQRARSMCGMPPSPGPWVVDTGLEQQRPAARASAVTRRRALAVGTQRTA